MKDKDFIHSRMCFWLNSSRRVAKQYESLQCEPVVDAFYRFAIKDLRTAEEWALKLMES